tara:strand:- start:256 stop:474 length:219 start_codon:yes stop_codon:yes gene_type:complete
MSKSKKELAHDQFFYDLCDATENAAMEGLDVPHVVFVGIQYFTQLALDCAPNNKQAKELIKDAMKSAKKEEL